MLRLTVIVEDEHRLNHLWQDLRVSAVRQRSCFVDELRGIKLFTPTIISRVPPFPRSLEVDVNATDDADHVKDDVISPILSLSLISVSTRSDMAAPPPRLS